MTIDLFEALECFLLDSQDVSEVFAAVALLASVSAGVQQCAGRQTAEKHLDRFVDIAAVFRN